MSDVQSVVTPAAKVAPTKTKVKTKLFNGSAAASEVMTAEQAVAIAFESGQSFASAQDRLSAALLAFRGNETVRTDMLKAMNHGYLGCKLGYTQEEAEACLAKAKHSDKPNLQDDKHRTFEEQRVIDTVRVLWHRANKLAGTLPEKSESQIQAEVTRAAKEAEKESERKDYETKREEAWQIVHPEEDVDVNEAMTRLVSTMKAYHSKHASKFIGNKGTAWRDWLARAPK